MKKKVAILFGGRSAEHEISVLSAKNVAAALDLSKFELILLGISKQGTWYQFSDIRFLIRLNFCRITSFLLKPILFL